MAVPLLLLDVDGVVNALPRGAPDLAVWPGWETGEATAEGRAWPIRFAPAVVARLLDWHQTGRLELQWLTTWGHDANRGLHRLLGLPELAVAGTYRDAAAGGTPPGSGDPAAGAHSAVSPAAPDPLSGRWWKYDVVRRLLVEQPDRRLIWVDDELSAPASPYLAWAAAQPHVLAVGPDPRTGLSPGDLEQVEAALPPGVRRGRPAAG